jgi:Amt family ammonium transporter
MTDMNISFFKNSTLDMDTCTLNSADSVWVGLTSCLVMLMTPAVGFVYAGLVNKGAIGSMLGLCFAIFAVVTIIWALIGYTLVFGDSVNGIIGNMRYAGLSNLVDFHSKCIGEFGVLQCYKDHFYWESCGIPEILFLFFQNKFAAITPALIIGSISERMYMKHSLLFIAIWTLIIYCPVAHWTWNAEGFLTKLGARDFAGGLVVHMASGFSALVTSLFLGKRQTYGSGPEVPNFPYVILGTMMLWFGWFGFNGGSSYGINKIGIIALINTNISASSSLVLWLIMDLCVYKQITALGIAMGSICGLVAITPGAGYIDPRFSFVYGAIAAILGWTAIYYRKRYQFYDDLDVFSCHGICGSWGILATGIFANKNINPLLPLNGLAFSFNFPDEDHKFVFYQFLSILIISLYCGIVTFLILFFMTRCFALRAKSDEEIYYDHINFFDEYRMKKYNIEVIR